MRKVGIRQFRDNFYRELKDVPFTITIHGKPVYEIIKVNTDKNIVTIDKNKNILFD